jgi:hypothetical protein
MKVLVVSNEPVWPASNGGRVRIAGIIDGLSRSCDVRVAETGWEGPPSPDRRTPVEVVASLSRDSDPRHLRHFLGPRPRLGSILMSAQNVKEIRRIEADWRPDALLLSHSYLGAANAFRSPTIIDFPNIEIDRWRTFSRTGSPRRRAVAWLETMKAARWEPRVARTAALCLACTEHDVGRLRRWGATAMYVPHGSGAVPLGPSSATGPVLYAGSAGYHPNDEGARWFLGTVWPVVESLAPTARLEVVGRGTDSYARWFGGGRRVTFFGEVDGIEAYMRRSVAVVAPVRFGAGAQLKVVDALSRGRVLVATSYSARSAPRAARAGVIAADSPTEFADAVARMIVEVDERRRRERALVERRPVPSWDRACRPVVGWLRANVGSAT